MNRDYTVRINGEPFGFTGDGEPVTRWILATDDMEATILNYGATLQSLKVRDRDGNFRDVVLGYDTLKEYEDNTCYFGATVGRCANRIGGATFQLNGKNYDLAANNGPNCLHGGLLGFNRQVWYEEYLPLGIRFCLISPDGQDGFPGTMKATVTYQLMKDNSLSIHYEAMADADTICNLTNHAYFNLNGHGSGDVLEHQMIMHCDEYTPLDETFVPDGRILPVDGTPFDFRQAMTIGSRIGSDHPQIVQAGGYDHNFVVRPYTDDSADEPDTDIDGHVLVPTAETVSPISGIRMETLTTMPGVQLYTPNYEAGSMTGKGGAAYDGRCAFCLETQYFPNALAHEHFPQPVLPAGELYSQTTKYRFSVIE